MKIVDKETTQRIILLYELIESIAEEFECFDHCQKDDYKKSIEITLNFDDLRDILENDYLAYELEVLQRCGINFLGNPEIEEYTGVKSRRDRYKYK